MRRSAEDIRDEWLVLRWQSGEDAALRELVAGWQGRLYRHARRLVDRGDAAEEIVQEAWLAIVRGLVRLDDPSRFGPWAYRIVTNKCADWTRRRVRDRAEHARCERMGGQGVEVERGAASTHVMDDDDAVRELREAMRTLSPEHRATLALHYLDGMSTAQIALAMGVPAGTVKSRLHHARERLRAMIGDGQEPEERSGP